MRNTWLLAVALLLPVAPAALADSFQFTINSSVTEFFGNTNNDNFMGIYSTPPDAWGTQELVNTGTPGGGNSPFSNISFAVPAGDIITSATMKLILLPSTVQGTANVYFTGGGRAPLHPPDPWNPMSVPATLGSGYSIVTVEGLDTVYGTRFKSFHFDGTADVFDMSNLLTIEGNELSSAEMEHILLQVRSEILGHIESQGFNYASYMGGSGQADIPYTVEVDGTFSPVPEPSTFTLLGTGILGLAGVVRRRSLS